MTTIVVVGASLAGSHAASSIRKAGFEGELVIVGNEPHQPYDRPPLSKEFLTAGGDESRLPLPVAAPERLDAAWVTGTSASRLDVVERLIHLSDGRQLAYDGLVIATGARARLLPAAVHSSVGHSDGVVTLRTLDDARHLRARLLIEPDHVVICGAGFIGAEVAASVRQLGIEATLVDVAPAPLSRVLDESVGSTLAGFLADNGVRMIMSCGLESIEGGDGAVASVLLSNGERLQTQLVVVGIGAVPNTEWLDGSGLQVGHGPSDGLLVDGHCRASDRIVAAGDVARWPNERFGGRLMRVEQWDNAVEMGQYAGRSLLGAMGLGPEPDEPYQPVPWFWSDQFDRKIQLAGVVSSDWRDVVGDPSEERFVRTYFEGGALCGVLAWNRPRQAIVGRQLIAAGTDRNTAVERLSPAPA